MSMTPDEAEYEEFMDRLYEEHKEQAIEECTAELLRSYYAGHKLLAKPAFDAVIEARNLMNTSITAALVFSAIAMEVALKELENRVKMAKARRNIIIKDIRLRKGIREGIEGVEECRGIDFEEPFSLLRKIEERIEEETEFTLKRVKEKEAWEKEERLINEEIEMLKRDIKKGGSKK